MTLVCLRGSAQLGRNELLPILTCKAISYATRGKVYNSCVRGVLLHAGECWAPRVTEMQRLCANERWMLRWMYGKCQPDCSTSFLLKAFHLPCLENVLRSSRLRWYGHVQRNEGPINDITKLILPGKNPRGRPIKTWHESLKADLKMWKMPNTACNREEWRNHIRNHLKSNPI